MADEKKALPDEALEQVSGGTLNKREVTQYGMEDTLYDPSLILLKSVSPMETVDDVPDRSGIDCSDMRTPSDIIYP